MFWTEVKSAIRARMMTRTITAEKATMARDQEGAAPAIKAARLNTSALKRNELPVPARTVDSAFKTASCIS